MKIKCLTLFLLVSFNVFSQSTLSFGLNSKYYDSTFENLVQSAKPFNNFAKDYHLNFLRFPGGLEARCYFWDKPSLIPQSRLLYADFIRKNVPDKQYKADYNERLSTKEDAKVADTSYEQFLKFSKRSGVIPIIVLNTWYYHNGNKVLAICSDSADWNMILDNIKKQIIYSHRFYESTIYWEIGNEDHHILKPNDYAVTASKYATVIKQNFPNDKVLINFANPTSKKIETDWNGTMIKALASSKAIQYIDFVAPHYYRAYKPKDGKMAKTSKTLDDADNIASRFTTINIFEETQKFDETLRAYPNIHIFFTEFGLFPKVSNPNYNSQLEGLLMFYYLMQYNGSPRVEGIIRHGFTQTSSAFYFNRNTFKDLGYNFTPDDDKANDIFQYIPPKAKATKIFFDNNPAKAGKLVNTSTYSYTITNLPDRTIINMLNFTGTAENINVSSLQISSSLKNVNAVNYRFPDLNSKQWNYDNTKIKITSTIQLAPYSYSVITATK